MPEHCKRDPNWTTHIPMDLADPADVERFIAEACDILGDEPLNALVNNAALSPKSDFQERLGCLNGSLDDWREVFQLNFFTPLALARGFSIALARAARADLEVSQVETRRMEQALVDFGGLSRQHAALAAEMASHRNVLRGASEDYLATREFRDISSPDDKLRLLHCLFAVCAADDSISLVEEEEVRQVASELGLEHADYVRARSAFRDKREVLKGLLR